MADNKESREVESTESNAGEITVTVTADVGDAITGFKSLQRELRATTKAAREMEQAYKDAERAINDLGANKIELDGVALAELIEPELARRETIRKRAKGSE